MVGADIAPVMEMTVRGKWRAREPWFEFAVSQSACFPILAEENGVPVGTGIGTVNGPAGWVATIFVDPERRGRGLGRSLTQAVIDRLEAAGCRTLVLVATDEGRRLYERMGFEVDSRYHVLEVPGLDPGAPGTVAVAPWDGHVRAFEAGDLESIAALDRAATGEDRRHALARFAAPESAKVAIRSDDGLDGFVVRAAWGGGATIARTPGAALAILDARRRAAGPDDVVRLGVLEENSVGLELLVKAGVTEAWSAPRMIRGAPLEWRPAWIWGQFNYGMG